MIPPKEILLAAHSAQQSGSFDKIQEMDQVGSVLVDLWGAKGWAGDFSNAHTRMKILDTGYHLIKAGVRLGDYRAGALEKLLEWHIPTPVSGDISSDEAAAWVRVFKALQDAGQSLRPGVCEDFEAWAQRDVWCWLAGKPHLESVARTLVEDGALDVYIPAQPHWRGWPKDPTLAMIEEAGFVSPAWCWIAAIKKGYPLGGELGPRFLVHVCEWDVTGKAVRAALDTGQVDVHRPLGRQGTALEAILNLGGFALANLPTISALLEHDPTVLDATDDQNRPLHAVVLEHLASLSSEPSGVRNLPYVQQALEKIKSITRAHRLSLRMGQVLPSACSIVQAESVAARKGRL